MSWTKVQKGKIPARKNYIALLERIKTHQDNKEYAFMRLTDPLSCILDGHFGKDILEFNIKDQALQVQNKNIDEWNHEKALDVEEEFRSSIDYVVSRAQCFKESLEDFMDQIVDKKISKLKKRGKYIRYTKRSVHKVEK
jgi:NTP pyrophosphatase (non-canonical NTP hydrolase)